MPAFLAMLLGGLINIAATLAGRVMVALGIGAVTYTGVRVSLEWLKSQAVANLQALPADVLNLLAFLKVGEAISIIFSAILVRLVLTGLTSDSIRRFVAK